MFISKITLSNYRAVKSLSLGFSDGANVVEGPNHGGKTTVLEAVSWLLADCLLRGGANVAEIRPFGGSDEEKTEAEAVFVVDGDEIVLKKTLEDVLADGKIAAHKTSFFVDGVQTQTAGAYREAFLEKAHATPNLFGLSPERALTDPRYIPDLCYSPKWKEARSFLLSVIGAPTKEQVLANCPESVSEALKGLDFYDPQRAIDAETALLKEAKRAIARNDGALDFAKSVKTGLCPICGGGLDESHLAEWLKKLSGEGKEAKRKALCTETLIENLSAYALVYWGAVESKAESDFGVRFNLIQKNLKGTIEETCEPLINGNGWSNGSQSEQIMKGIEIIEAVKAKCHEPDFPILVDEGGELTESTIESYKGNSQLLIAKAIESGGISVISKKGK